MEKDLWLLKANSSSILGKQTFIWWNWGLSWSLYSHIVHVIETSMTKQGEPYQNRAKQNKKSPQKGSDGEHVQVQIALENQLPHSRQYPKSHFLAARSLYGAAWNDLKQYHSCRWPGESELWWRISLRVQVFLFSALLSHHHPPLTTSARRRLCMKSKKRKQTLSISGPLPLTFLNRQHSTTASYPLNYIPPYLSTPPTPTPSRVPSPLVVYSLDLRHSRGTGRSSLCASLRGRLRACGL